MDINYLIRKDHLEVFLENKKCLICDRKFFLKIFLSKRKFSSEEDFYQWFEQVETKQAYRFCLYLLARKDYYSGDIVDKLSKRYFSAKTIQKTINLLKKNAYLDDKRWIQRQIEKEKNKGYGRYKILFQLKRKKVARELLQKALDQYYPIEEEKNVIREVKKKYQKRKNLQQMLFFLKRRGFSYFDESIY